jgi:hypothetical protein
MVTSQSIYVVNFVQILVWYLAYFNSGVLSIAARDFTLELVAPLSRCHLPLSNHTERSHR